MRLFAALELPAEAADHLNLALQSVRRAAGTLRWLHHAQWHITMAFYGEVTGGEVEELSDALTAVARASAPMSLQLSGAGSFSGRTLWMGVSGHTRGDEATLVDLMAACRTLGDEPDRDRNRAHLTVARAGRRSTGAPLADLVRALSIYRGPLFEVDQVGLYSSQLGAGPGGGALHERLASAPLGQGGISAGHR